MSGFPGEDVGKSTRHNTHVNQRQLKYTLTEDPGHYLHWVSQGGIPEIVGYLCHFIFIF